MKKEIENHIKHLEVTMEMLLTTLYSDDELKCGPDDNFLEPKSKLPLSHSLDHKVFSSALCV